MPSAAALAAYNMSPFSRIRLWKAWAAGWGSSVTQIHRQKQLGGLYFSFSMWEWKLGEWAVVVCKSICRLTAYQALSIHVWDFPEHRVHRVEVPCLPHSNITASPFYKKANGQKKEPSAPDYLIVNSKDESLWEFQKEWSKVKIICFFVSIWEIYYNSRQWRY